MIPLKLSKKPNTDKKVKKLHWITINLEEDISSELALNDRLVVNQALISGVPLSIDNIKGLKWGNFINEGFTQGS